MNKNLIYCILICFLISGSSFSKNYKNEIEYKLIKQSVGFNKSDLEKSLLSQFDDATEVIIHKVSDIKVRRRSSGKWAHLQFIYKPFVEFQGVTMAEWEPGNWVCYSNCIDKYVKRYNDLLDTMNHSKIALITDENGDLLRFIFIDEF